MTWYRYADRLLANNPGLKNPGTTVKISGESLLRQLALAYHQGAHDALDRIEAAKKFESASKDTPFSQLNPFSDIFGF